MKLKHNKLRNPSILFELLVRQITTDTLNNRESKAVDILKKHYNNTQISKEYKIYNTLSQHRNLSEAKANVLLNIAVEAHKKLNKNSLKNQKYDLISDIKENYNIDEFFKAKVDNYKTLASIYMLFEMYGSNEINPEEEAKHRFTIMESIADSPKSEKLDPVLETYNAMDKGTKSMVYKILVQKYNDKYSSFDDNQKTLLKEYITNISTSDTLREHINSELVKVRSALKKHTDNLKDEVRKVKMNEVFNFMEEIPSNKQVCEKDIHNLLYYYELLKEFGKNGS